MSCLVQTEHPVYLLFVFSFAFYSALMLPSRWRALRDLFASAAMPTRNKTAPVLPAPSVSGRDSACPTAPVKDFNADSMSSVVGLRFRARACVPFLYPASIRVSG